MPSQEAKRVVMPNARPVSDSRSRAGYASMYTLLLGTGAAGVLLWGALGSDLSRPELHGAIPGIHAQAVPSMERQATDVQALLTEYCVACHNERRGTSDLAFDTLDASSPAAHPATW